MRRLLLLIVLLANTLATFAQNGVKGRVVEADGYPCVSLSVQKANYALQMYRKVGFIPVSDHGDELLMVCPFQ